MMTTSSGENFSSVKDNLKDVQNRIQNACLRSGRDLEQVRLIAVSKSQHEDRVLAALDAGQRIFGENYVQEADKRWPNLRQHFQGLEIHMIGPLQSNKAAKAVEIFDVIQSVDRLKLAKALAVEMTRKSKKPVLFCQVNTGREPQKAGILPENLEEFLQTCRQELDLKFQGLMAIPPAGEDIAPHTLLLKKFALRYEIKEISIGMSADYETAVEFGATIVRVGSSVFGARLTKTSQS